MVVLCLVHYRCFKGDQLIGQKLEYRLLIGELMKIPDRLSHQPCTLNQSRSKIYKITYLNLLTSFNINNYCIWQCNVEPYKNCERDLSPTETCSFWDFNSSKTLISRHNCQGIANIIWFERQLSLIQDEVDLWYLQSINS